MKNALIILVFLISGCVGDRLDFRNNGSVYKKENNSICINEKENKILTYYLLTSSEDNYRNPLLFEDNIKIKHPTRCFNVNLKNGITYNLLYEMDDIKYRVNFKLDEKNNIIQGVNNL